MNREGKKSHLIKTNRRIITMQEWSYRLGKSRTQIHNIFAEYSKRGGKYDPRDIYSVLDFYGWYVLISTFPPVGQAIVAYKKILEKSPQ